MYHVSAQGVDERMISVHYYYYGSVTVMCLALRPPRDSSGVKKPSLDSFKSNLKTFLFPKLKTCHVFRSVLLSSSRLKFSVFAARFKLCLKEVFVQLVCAGASVVRAFGTLLPLG